MRELPDWLRVLCSLIVAALLFALAYRQFSAVPKVIRRYQRAGIKRESIPPTAIGQYRASGVAFAALGLICVVLALRKERTDTRRQAQREDRAPDGQFEATEPDS